MLTAFDLDGTLLKCNSSLAFSRFLYRRGVFSLSERLYCLYIAFAHKAFGMPLQKLHTSVFKRLFLGKSLEAIKEQVFSFIPTIFPEKLYEPTMQRLREAKERGDTLLLLSSSPDFLVEPIALALGLPFISTKYCVDKHGNLCNISLLMVGRVKAEILRDWTEKLLIDKNKVTAYSDHFDDIDFLREAGTAVAVNPCPKLRRFCKNHNWEII